MSVEKVWIQNFWRSKSVKVLGDRLKELAEMLEEAFWSRVTQRAVKLTGKESYPLDSIQMAGKYLNIKMIIWFKLLTCSTPLETSSKHFHWKFQAENLG